uniref:Uncharacterized protein n=1 Tax=Arundo donax TaxID=35708 RepID=A0A0A9HEV1_ARUDO
MLPFNSAAAGVNRFFRIDKLSIHRPSDGSNISTSEKTVDPSPPPIAYILSFNVAPARLPFSCFKRGHVIHSFLPLL